MRIEILKRAILTVLGIYVGWIEFSDDVAYWLPPLDTVYGGHLSGQTVILDVLAAIAFGPTVALSY